MELTEIMQSHKSFFQMALVLIVAFSIIVVIIKFIENRNDADMSLSETQDECNVIANAYTNGLVSIDELRISECDSPESIRKLLIMRISRNEPGQLK